MAPRLTKARAPKLPQKNEAQVLREVVRALSFSGLAIVLDTTSPRSTETWGLYYEREADRVRRLSPSTPPVAVLWRQNTGMARLPDRRSKTGTRPVRFGLVGQSDLTGVVAPYGVRLEIEVKRDVSSSRESPAQQGFGTLMMACRAVRLVVRSADEAVTMLRAEMERLAEEERR